MNEHALVCFLDASGHDPISLRVALLGRQRHRHNNWGGAGRWAFLEVTDPWDAGNLIREKILAYAQVDAHA